MLLKCSFPAAIVKGIIEHGDGATYFASFGGFPTYLAEAQTLGWVVGAKEVTAAGRAMYEAERLDLLPQSMGSRAYMWPWRDLRGAVEVVTPEHACVAIGHPPNRCTCDASHLDEGIWYLNRLFVAESLRGQGVGGALLRRMVKLLQGQGTLVVDPGGYGSNPAELRRWYRKQGFQRTPTKGRLQYNLGS